MSAHANAAYIDSDSSFDAVHGQKALMPIPVQTITITDYYGTYTKLLNVGVNGYPYNDPTRMGSRSFIPPALTDAGQLSGNFSCSSPTFNCLGAYSITYTLPEKVSGIYGMLAVGFGASSNTHASDVPFFGFDWNYVDPKTGSPHRYNGFWGTLFDTPTDTFTITWTPGLNSRDDGSCFVLSDAMVLVAPGVTVPEPASAAIFGMGLLGLAAVRRRAA
jgi:hypothetical protein